MSDPGDGNRLLLAGLMALWVMAFGYAFVAAEGAGAGVSRNALIEAFRVYAGWQAIAGTLALAIAGVGWRWPRGTSVRRLGLLPIALAALQVAAFVGLRAVDRI